MLVSASNKINGFRDPERPDKMGLFQQSLLSYMTSHSIYLFLLNKVALQP